MNNIICLGHCKGGPMSRNNREPDMPAWVQVALDYPIPEGLDDRFPERDRLPRIFLGTQVVFLELKKFLVLTAEEQRRSGVRCSPPPTIDVMWHHFILDNTQVYIDYCTKYLGMMVHHRNNEVTPYEDRLMPLADELGVELNDRVWRPYRHFWGGCG